MAENTEFPTEPAPALVTVTHLVYALHALSLLIGVLTAATIIGAFVFGVPSIIAVVINYLKMDEARGTFLESHFRWRVIGTLLIVTLIGIPLALAVFFADSVWVIYRIVRGWLALRDRKPMYANG